MKIKFEHKESYKHLYAKILLTSWLRDLDENQDHCSFGQLHWRSNWGVHDELPFFETSDPFYFELSDGLKYDEENGGLLNYKQKEYNHQNYFDKKFNRGIILFVPDITIFHKGSATILVEVVHKSAPTDNKLNNIMNFFNTKGCCPELFTIEADHILGQIKKPKSLNFTKLL